MVDNKYISLGLLLIVAGFLLIVFSTIFTILPGNVEGGGVFCIVIFFIPICIGIGNLEPNVLYTLVFITMLVFVVFVIFLWLIIYRTYKHLYSSNKI